ncbi:hypothetical protein MMA38_23690, partial [Salmonella enterica]|nr:hypothetical protein [Salmonella enterica]
MGIASGWGLLRVHALGMALKLASPNPGAALVTRCGAVEACGEAVLEQIVAGLGVVAGQQVT